MLPRAQHQIPDFWKALALRKIADMLRPGGVLRLRDPIYDFQPAEAGEGNGGWFAGAVADPAAGFEIASVSFRRRLYGAYTCVKAPR